MEQLLNLLLLSAVLFVACEETLDYSNKPDRCDVAPELLYRQCCLFPPFFTGKSCGAMFQVLPFVTTSNSSRFQRIVYDVCRYWKCILKTYDLLGPDGNADIVKYFTHLDKWVELNSHFSNVMSDAKIFCKKYNTLRACEFHNLHRCIRHYIDVHCPIIVPTELCKEQKEFYQECAEYYV